MEKGYRSAVVLSLAVCFMFFLYAPLELYFTNKDEFWYDIWVLLPVMVCVFLIFTGICLGGGFWVLYKYATKLFQVGEVFLFILFVCSYVQGNYLIGYLPVFDGRSIDWSLYAAEGRIQSVILWIVVTVIVILAVKLMRMERMYALIQVVSICMVLMFVLTLSTLCITNHGLESKTNICVTTDYEMTMSTNQNCIILLLDALDGGAFSDIVVGNDELESVFDDFTYYDNTVSAYPSTTYNVPFILSGMWFENQMTSNQYFESVLTSSPLFAELEKREYVIDLYETDLRIDESTGKRFENIGRYTKKISSFSSFARWQILLTGMKYAPFDLKRFSFVNPNAFEKLRILEGDSEAYHDSNKDFYNLLVEEELQYRNEKNFKFVHLWGGHPPYEYDKDMNYLAEGGTYVQSVESCITLTNLYLQKLKEGNVYDNSIIIIIADHGNNDYYEEDNMNQHPILLVKGINERHGFQTDNRPISFSDLQDAYIQLLDGGDGQVAFNEVTNDKRNRRFIWYDIKDDTHMVEYEQTGRSGAMDTMVPTGREYNACE